MYDFDRDVIDALIKNKPGKGNVDKVKDEKYGEDYIPDQIVMVVDRSGSMGSIKEDAEGGINSFITDNQKEGKALFTMVEFDTNYDVLCYKIPLDQIDRYNLRPRGMTALNDAIGQAFADVDEGDKNDEHSKIGVIVTDGGENASKEWTKDAVFARIEKLKEKGWEFIFLAANQDAIETGSDYGFGKDTTLNFNDESVSSVYSAATAYSVSHRGGRGMDFGAKKMRASAAMDSFVESDEVLSSINTHKTSDSTDAQYVPSSVNITNIPSVDINNMTITEDDINAVLNETPVGFDKETLTGYVDELKVDLKKALAEEDK